MSTIRYHFKRNANSPLDLVDEQALENAIRAQLGPRNGQHYDWARAHETFKDVDIVTYTDDTGVPVKKDVFRYDTSLHKTALFRVDAVLANPWIRLFARLEQNNPVRSTPMVDWLDAVLLGRTPKEVVALLRRLTTHIPDDASVPALTGDPILDYLRDRTLHLGEEGRLNTYNALLAALEPVMRDLRNHARKTN